MNNTQHLSSAECVSIARRVTWTGFWVNAGLSVAKIIVGITARSGALVADGVHSLSDFLTDFIVLIMVGISRKEPDRRHEFGHGKYETLATVMLALVLLIVAIGIMYSGITAILRYMNGEALGQPGVAAPVMCALSIVSKEWLYQYTVKAGRRIHSEAVIANAWHHRSDALSSLATFVGVGGAIFFGSGAAILDPIAAIIVAVFIMLVAIKMILPAIGELLDNSLPERVEAEIIKAITTTPGVISYERLRTRRSGAIAIINVEIKVEPAITVAQGHEIATVVENNIRAAIDDPLAIVATHVEPA
ncbi:MAG: cation diffusion facilitator family transporter [Muribaculaceae bacterium]